MNLALSFVQGHIKVGRKGERNLLVCLPQAWVDKNNILIGERFRFVGDKIIVFIPPEVYQHPDFDYLAFKRKLMEL